MKYAFMSFSTPTLGLAETLQLAKKIGYAGIEPRTSRKHAHGIELERTPQERKEIARQAADSSIAICCLALSTQYVTSVATPGFFEETCRYIELAKDIDCPRLRVFGGSLPEGMEQSRAVEIMVEGLAKSAPDAGAAGVTICLETHDAWTDPTLVAEVLQSVNHPSIMVNWDIMHPVRRSRVPMRESFEILRPWIRHVHIHDGTLADPLVLKPCGEGDLDISTALQSLLEMQYDGFISGEWIDQTNPIDLGDEFIRMKNIEREAATAFAR